jgi:catechol 2,3-dioxygenase-like lactoylglutathione lyase family enzyme
MAEPLIKVVSHVRIFCMPEAWRACTEFYRDVLELRLIGVDAGAGAAIFKIGDGPTLSLEQVDPADPADAEMVGRFTSISFRVDDIEAACRTLSARGVHFDHSPKQESWGGIVAHFRDPAANMSTLVQHPL